MSYVNKYLKFLFSLDHAIGVDVRSKMESYSYENFIQKMTKSVRFDSYAFAKNIDPEF